MRKITVITLLAFSLCACSTSPPAQSPYGNFVQAVDLDEAELVTDALKQLSALHAPARSRIELQQQTPDQFGQSLVNGLREKGFGVLESTSTSKTSEPTLPLNYLLDHAGETGLYLLTITVGNQTLNRLYRGQDCLVEPAGYWVLATRGNRQ